MIYAGDLECTTDPGDCRVWAFGIEEIYTHEYAVGTSMRGLLNWLTTHQGTLYFHNLAYDGRFIIDALLREGYRWTNDKDLENDQFSTLITDDNKFYAIRVGELEILDSLKIIPMSIAAMAKAFALPVTKGECDYDIYRAPGSGMSGTEYSYLYADVHILALSLVKAIEMGATKMTIGASSLASFKSNISRKSWSLLFPQLDTATDAAIRRAYRGGFTYLMPEFADIDLNNMISVDYNSMYPSMLLDKPYPVGEPIPFDGNNTTKELYTIKLSCSFTLKPGHVPFIPEKAVGRFQQASYLSESDGVVTLHLTSTELETFFESYDVDVMEWGGGYEYRSVTGLFDHYIDYWKSIKEQSTGGIRTMSKLYLNSLYGKFGTSPLAGYRVPTMSVDKDLVLYPKVADERDTIYIPVAAFCTAYARRELIESINKNYDRFVYCDTDSMYLLGDAVPANIPISDNLFSHWKVEKYITRARFLRSKTYIVESDGHLSVTCAGMTPAIKRHVTWENFHVGFSNMDKDGNIRPGWDKLTPKVVPGGVVLQRRKFMIQ